MEQIGQLKEIRTAAKIRLDRARDDIKAQLLALEHSADAKLVKSLGTLISELESTISESASPSSRPAATSYYGQSRENNESTVKGADSGASEDDDKKAPSTAAKAETLTALTDQLRSGAGNSN